MYSVRKRVREKQVTVRCSQVELVYIKACAKKTGKALSVYVREVALQGFTSRDTSLPPEVLTFQGHLAQVCGLLEVIARKRLDGDELNALERAQLKEVSQSLQKFIEHIKQHVS